MDTEYGIWAGTAPVEREKLRNLRDHGKNWYLTWRLMLEAEATDNNLSGEL